MRVAESIAAIDPELVECLSADGSLIRAMRPGRPEDQLSSPPEVPAALASDPHAAMICLFAQLLYRATEHSTEVAFTKLVELVERMGERSDAIEKRLERTEAAYRREQAERIDDLWDRAEEMAQAGNGEGAKEMILRQFLGGMNAGRSARGAETNPPASKPNGGTE